MPQSIHLLVIDPQNDFCQPTGSLAVPGADKDMDRLALMVHRLKDKLTDIHVTLDSHRKVDISHPFWWTDSAGNAPAPFTMIPTADVVNGKWTTRMAGAWDRSLAYLKDLEAKGRYPHVVWPEHCLIGSEGHNVFPVLFDAMQEWAERFAMVDYVTKGSNPWTEHFSAVQAEVPDAADPSTQINTGLVRTLEDADIVLLAGEASSHCLANSVRDIVTHFGSMDAVKKMVLLEDATSPVPGFESLETAFKNDLIAMGMQVSTTDQFLATA